MNKRHVVAFIPSLMFFVVFRTATAASGINFQCDGNPEFYNYLFSFDRCQFLSTSQVATQLECIAYGEISKTKYPEYIITKVLKFRMVFVVQRKAIVINELMNVPSTCWCVRTSRIELELVNPNIPNGSNVIKLSNELERLRFIDELRIQINYSEEIRTSQFNKSSGFLYLRNECDPEIRPLLDGCYNVRDLKVAYKMQMKQLVSFDLKTNIEQLKKFHLLKSGGIIEHFSVKSSINISPLLDVFQDVTVKQLNLSNNDVGRKLRDKNAFPRLMSLTHLYLSNCKIVNFNPYNFENIIMVEVLDFSHNSLSAVPLRIRLLARLRELDLSFQNSRSNDFDLKFDSLPSLVRLRLDGLQITSLNRSNFNNILPSLKYLSLQSCTIKRITEDAFSGMPKLEYLDLSNNHNLTSIHPNAFLPITSYLTLLLHDCPNINFARKLNLTYIKLLDISYCNITKTPNELISSKNIINYVDLSNNFISDWIHFQSFGSRTLRINHVNLSYNAIQVINKNMGRALRTVKSTDLGFNPFDCQSCELDQFQTWLSAPSTRVSNLGKNKSLTCMYPLNNKGETILDVEYLCTENTKYGFTLGLPFGLILIGGTLIGSLAYVYRFEIVYAKHLWQMKRRNETNVKGASAETKFDAFISYCAADRAWVMEKLVPNLEPPGGHYSLCLHERDFPLGSFIMDNIVDNIEKSRRVLFVLSNNFLGSEWCKWELRMATHRIFERSASDFLVLLELERLHREQVPLSLRVLLATRTYLEWHQHQPEVFWSRLKQTLGKPLSRPVQEPEESDEPFKDVDELLVTLEMLKRDPEMLENFTKEDE